MDVNDIEEMVLESIENYERYSEVLSLSGERPNLFYPKWDFFVGLLSSDNAYRRALGAKVIANIVAVDSLGKFELIFDKYFGLLEDKISVAGHIAICSVKIFMAKPHLEGRIMEKLFAIEDSTHKHKGLLKSYVIEAFEAIFPQSRYRSGIIGFVERALDSDSPKTRKMAKTFLKKHGPK